MENASLEQHIEKDVVERFSRYVKFWTTSDPSSPTKPSSLRQNDLLKLLAAEMCELGLVDVSFHENGFVYGTLEGNSEDFIPFGLMAHVDTSPDQSGENVVPQFHCNYDGGQITFPDDPTLILSAEDSPELKDFIGSTIITASGTTLLGADDKAGVAEIMSSLRMFKEFPELLHGKIVVCFTSDEEIGHGIDEIDVTRLPGHFYTIDGGYPGECEAECFDAIGVTLVFRGKGVHPGYSFGKMINAARVAALFVNRLPEQERPETTRGRDGFYHVSTINGQNETATISMLLRDFEHENNLSRLAVVREIAATLEEEHPGLKIEITSVRQYENMRDTLLRYPEVTARAERAIAETGLKVIKKPIRGGTDGSRLTALGIPTPNLFTGGMLAHSRREWVSVRSMCYAVRTIINLAKLHSINGM